MITAYQADAIFGAICDPSVLTTFGGEGTVKITESLIRCAELLNANRAKKLPRLESNIVSIKSAAK